MLTNPPIKHQSSVSNMHSIPIRLPLSLRRSLFRQCAQIPQSKTNRFIFQYVFPCHFAEVYSANALKFPIKDQTPQFPIRIPLSLRRSLFRQCAQIPQSKTNRFIFQYVFPCHFAEVYSANALKFPIKDQTSQFPIRLPLSLRRSLFRQCAQISNYNTNRFTFQYVFLCHFAEVYYANALKFPIKDQTPQFPIRNPLSLRRSLFRQCAQIPQLKTNRFHFQYASLCHFAEVYSANALKSHN
jgi:predicted nucleic-acid-binding Zn-ribbon protein